MNKRLLVLTASLALLLAPALADAAATKYVVDPVHSNVTFTIRHFVSNVQGRFTDFSGTILYDPENLEASSVEFTVEAASIDTHNDRRDNHLRSPDFFDVEKHPTLSFKSTRVARKDETTLEVTGNLTIRGVTREVTIPVQVLGFMDTPMGYRGGFESHFTLDRTDYGVQWNRALEGGGAVLGNEVKISILVEAAREG